MNTHLNLNHFFFSGLSKKATVYLLPHHLAHQLLYGIKPSELDLVVYL